MTATNTKVASPARNDSKTARQTARAEGKPADAIRLLKEDHREVKGWFKDYEKLEDDAEKQKLAATICLALTVHAKIEEEIFYPAARAAIKNDDLLNEAQVEHASAKKLIAELQKMKASDKLFDAKVTVLGEYINHHVEEEESEMFPAIQETDLDLKVLGTQLADRKGALMAEAVRK